MMAPAHTTPSTFFSRAICAASCGTSNAPDTQYTSMASSAMPWAFRPSTAPSTTRLVMRSLKRLATTATRRPLPFNCARNSFGMLDPARRRRRSGKRLRQQMPELVALGGEVAAIDVVGLDLNGHAVDDVEPVRGQSHHFARIVGEQA